MLSEFKFLLNLDIKRPFFENITVKKTLPQRKTLLFVICSSYKSVLKLTEIAFSAKSSYKSVFKIFYKVVSNCEVLNSFKFIFDNLKFLQKNAIFLVSHSYNEIDLCVLNVLLKLALIRPCVYRPFFKNKIMPECRSKKCIN